MMKSVPEANTDLQKMAITAQNMALGLGLAPAKAAQVSESLLKLAGDASAFAHVPMAEALDALERGLAGKTKGLLQFGIAINEADIKERAMSMGLLHTGNELTETGTALAAYSLIMERSSRIQGEAANTAGQMGKQFAFLKRDLSELADNVSGIVLPALSDLARQARDVVSWFASLDQSTVKTFFQFAGVAALIGPVIGALTTLIVTVTKLKAAFTILSAGEGIAGVIAGIAALPFATIVLGIAGITAAVAALVVVWQKLHGQDKSDFIGPRNLTAPLGGADKSLDAALGINHTPDPGALARLAGGTIANAATERAPSVDPLKAMEDTAHRLTDAFKHMGDGWAIPNLTEQWVLLLAKAQAQYDGIKDKTSDIANRLRDIISSLNESGQNALSRAASGGGSRRS
jgi:hypothetical protein